jgi:sec-independent protein translocase protein TatA
MVGPWELIILLIIVVVIFGAGRLSQIGGALGKSVREFRSATQDETPTAKPAAATTPAAEASAAPVVAAPVAAAPGKTCSTCGHLNPAAQRFCSECGTALPSEAVVTPAPPAEVTCPSCATANPAGQAFCGQCGTRLDRAVSAA